MATVASPEPGVCCAPLLREPLADDDAELLAELLRVVADPVRLRLLSLVAAADGRQVCACELVDRLDRSQPTVSHHLKVLTEAGLLLRERRGRWVYYSLVPDRLAELRRALG